MYAIDFIPIDSLNLASGWFYPEVLILFVMNVTTARLDLLLLVWHIRIKPFVYSAHSYL